MYERLGCDTAALAGFDVAQPARLACTLHAYQRQAVGWMRWREMSDGERRRRGDAAEAAAEAEARTVAARGGGGVGGVGSPVRVRGGGVCCAGSPGRRAAAAAASLHPAWAEYSFGEEAAPAPAQQQQ